MTGIKSAARYTTGPFKGFGHCFAISTTDQELTAYLEELWGACRADQEPVVTYSLEVIPARAGSATLYRLSVDGMPLSQTSRPSVALRNLVRRINHDVIAAADDLVVVHASGAMRNGIGALFPAPMEAGKTTLVAGLLRAGWRYLSDEAVGIDPTSLELWPYPKPLSIDPGSWDVLADLEPRLPESLLPYSDDQWQVAPDGIRPHAIARAVRPGVIIAPRYTPGAVPTLEPLSGASMVMRLAESCFTLRTRNRDVLPVLGRVARQCACYLLTVGNDLQDACRLIGQAVEEGAHRDSGG